MTGIPAGGGVIAGMIWMAAAGIQFNILNAFMRGIAIDLGGFEAQFLRYSAGPVVMLPLILRTGLPRWRPHSLRGQAWRGIIHTAGLLLWFWALPHVPLAELTAIGFTGPLFIMIGAVIFLGEKVILARWIAAIVGAFGVAIVVGPGMTTGGGSWGLVMLASTPLFGASFLITKALTRYDRPEVIVLWQAITVSLFTLPFAIPGWTWPTATQWGITLIAGILGSCGHYCLTQAFRIADISATQPIRFLDLLWASLLGFAMFGDAPTTPTLIGAAMTFAASTWLVRIERRRVEK
jgi:drug/metabolite transporter (DMT)-like permease